MDIAIPFPLVGAQEKEKETVTTGSWRWVCLGRRRILWMYDGLGLKRVRFLCQAGTRPVLCFETAATDWVDTLLFYKHEKDSKPYYIKPLENESRINYAPHYMIELHLQIAP